MRIFLIIAVTFLIPLSRLAEAQDGVAANLALFYSNLNYDFTKIGGGEGKQTQLNYSFTLGYTLTNQLYLGVIYEVLSQSNDTDTLKDTNLGASIGYRANGWEITAHYFLSAENELSITNKLTDGNGFGLDLAYLWSINSAFYLGPQLSYRSLTYSKYSVSGNKTAADTSQSYMLPYVVLGLKF